MTQTYEDSNTEICACLLGEIFFGGVTFKHFKFCHGNAMFPIAKKMCLFKQYLMALEI